MIRLIEVTQRNWEKCCALSVSKEQAGFVASNVYSLAESKYEPDRFPLGIESDGELVGFAMYGYDPDEDTAWILRLMIDQAHQHRGYGKQALHMLIDLLASNYQTANIKLCVEPENEAAIQLYRSAGFEDTGKIWGRELVFMRTKKP